MTGRGANWVDEALREHEEHTAAEQAAAVSRPARQADTPSDREQQVLSLITAGHPTREVAQELCYSERTVKNVLHDVVTKLYAALE